jgi:cytochrome c-type biogenesis protein CcmH
MKNKRSRTGYRFLLFITLVGIVFSAKEVWAQEVTPSDDQVNQIAQQLYCPVCENVPLDECMTEACQQWRTLIRQRLAEGWTDQEIIDYFVTQYGDKVLGEPPRQGLNWILYLFPPFLILIAMVLLLRKFRNPKKNTQNLESQDAYLVQVERDLEDSD